MQNPAKLITNKLPKMLAAFDALVQKDVLVGVPKAKTARPDEPINNATLAYIHDNGAPASNVPARPFMRPGITRATPAIRAEFKIAASAVLTGNKGLVNASLNRAGLAAQNAIRAVITEGIPPPLKPETIAARKYGRKTASRRKGEKEYMKQIAEGATPAEAQASVGITPLVNTGQLRNSITYVVKK